MKYNDLWPLIMNLLKGEFIFSIIKLNGENRWYRLRMVSLFFNHFLDCTMKLYSKSICNKSVKKLTKRSFKNVHFHFSIRFSHKNFFLLFYFHQFYQINAKLFTFKLYVPYWCCVMSISTTNDLMHMILRKFA